MSDSHIGDGSLCWLITEKQKEKQHREPSPMWLGDREMATKKASLEDNMVSLEEMLEKLNDEDISLDDAMKLYEDGMKLIKECNKAINLADKKVKVLRGDGTEDEL